MSAIERTINNGFRSLVLSLCDVVYRLIIFFFDIFEKIGASEILNEPTIRSVYQHIGLILGLFMIFRITFSAIQYLINPDTMMDKQKGIFNIVKKVFIVVVLLGVTPSLFNLAYDVQELVVKQNVLPRLITNTSVSVDGGSGGELAWYAFSSFYSPNKNLVGASSICGVEEYNLLEKDLKENGSFRYAYNCVNETGNYLTKQNKTIEDYIISFDAVLALVVGCAILWIIIMYTIQVGIRVVQLAYLQLIAPIPIMLYLDPKGDDRLNKWVKQCTTTYLDFFLRTAIIYFVVYIINILVDSDGVSHFMQSIGNVSDTEEKWIIIVMILALLVFAKKAPELFKELFPSSGGAAKFDFGLSPKKVFNDTLAAGLIGGAVGAVGAGASNAVHGFMNMRKAWNKNAVTMKKWNDLTEEERKGKNEKDYNKLRNGQIWKRIGSTAGAGAKGVASIVGGQIGGARAGLKTKDITKSGEAIKTANKNREERELRTQAGYHWYNPLPAIEDKILEFSGDITADDIKNKQQVLIDERKKKKDLAEGERLYKLYSKPKSPGSSEMKLDIDLAFKNEAYKKTYLALADAKGEAKKAALILSQEEANLNAAYNNANLHSDDEKLKLEAERLLKVAKERYEIAYGNDSFFKKKEEDAKKDHENSKKNKNYEHDAKIEELYKLYADSIAQPKSLEPVVPFSNEENQFAENQTTTEDVTNNPLSEERRVNSNSASNDSNEFSKIPIFVLEAMRGKLEEKDRTDEEDQKLKRLEAEISKRKGSN